MTVREILEATGGELITGSLDEMVTGVSTDSRHLKGGELFLALQGEHHDGHDYLEEVIAKGAAALIVDRSVMARAKNLIQVKDTLRALGDLAHAWRKRFQIPVVAITGSNGKTTTKDLTAAVLGSQWCVLKTEGNFNNLIGLPLTLLRLDEKIQVAVVEMGMNRSGEIDRLAEIAEPQIGVITNIARAHLEGMGNLSRIARTKGELLARLPEGGLCVLNKEDSYFTTLSKLAQKKVKRGVKTFGKKRGDYHCLSITADGLKGTHILAKVGSKKLKLKLNLLGQHNVSNVLAAVAVGDSLGISLSHMKKGLESYYPASKRMETVSLPRKIDVINDCYNANPDSMMVSLDFFKEISVKRRHVAILGEMLEMGSQAAKYHREVGVKAGQSGVNLLFAVGAHAIDIVRGARKKMKATSCFAFDSLEEALPSIRLRLLPGDLVLVKGSRGMRMERVTEEITRLGVSEQVRSH